MVKLKIKPIRIVVLLLPFIILKSVIDELRDSIDAELLYDGYYD